MFLTRIEMEQLKESQEVIHYQVWQRSENHVRTCKSAFAGGSEAAFSAVGLVETRQLLQLCHGDLLEDELGDAVSATNVEGRVAKVEKQHHHVTAVIFVDDTGADVNAVFGRQTRSRSHASVCSVGNLDLDIGFDASPFAGFDDHVLGGVQIVSGGDCRASRRRFGLFAQFGESQRLPDELIRG